MCQYLETVNAEEDRSKGGRALEDLVKARALELRMSMRGLARASGVGTNTLYNWFSGKTAPRTGELSAVADALGLPLSVLLNTYQGRAESPAGADQRMTISREELEALLQRAAEAAVRRVLAETEPGERGRDA